MTESSLPPEDSCKNCARPLKDGDKYCPGCGQKKYTGPPTLWGLFSELFETVFNLDNRLFRTLRDLPIPGQLTIKYLAGVQRPFFQPLRLFFVSTVLMLGAYSIFAVDRVGESFDASVESRRSNAYHRLFEFELRAELDTLAEEFPDPDARALLDTIRTRHLSASRDSMSLAYLDLHDLQRIQDRTIYIDVADYNTMSPEQIPEKYGVKGWLNRYQISQNAAINRAGGRGVANLMGQMIWGILILIPLTALMLKLFYVRRKRTYVEHMVFSLHVHSFLFLFQALAALVFYWFDSPAVLWASIPVTIVYFIVAQKRVYRQGWGKTLIKAFLMFFGYNFILTISTAVAMVFSLILY
ncbi:DUF3667 domain-containing protein [Lewinella sp. W8]|uniref:DUF3667 domain-containing protein n=1 Tax=Lewinella sp. W8 TaxID=2528208 RepID=UPI0015674E1C|nr:DUF3667 domain-containing protein [Lewinella sp. W8]